MYKLSVDGRRRGCTRDGQRKFGDRVPSFMTIVESLLEERRVKMQTPEAEAALKEQYLRNAIEEYEYSPAPEYDKTSMSPRAAAQGTHITHSFPVSRRSSRR
jgi:hypothetical protein